LNESRESYGFREMRSSENRKKRNRGSPKETIGYIEGKRFLLKNPVSK